MSSEERAIEPLELDEREDRENSAVSKVAGSSWVLSRRDDMRDRALLRYRIIHIRWREK